MPTELELSMLRQFCAVCDEICECRLIRTLNDQDHSITISRNPAENRLPHYDKDDFRSFATLFRKIDANDEPTNIYKIIKILQRYSKPEEHYTFKEIKALLHEEAEHPAIAIAIGPPGAEEPFSPRKIRNVIFNGRIFHTAPDVQDSLSRILDFEPFAAVEFLRYASIVVNVAINYAACIRFRNFFLPEPATETEG
jgi:hypothetical protein